jgi:ABC-type nitrate/sulfonate/bicarbonate transport system substrate-binding protein
VIARAWSGALVVAVACSACGQAEDGRAAPPSIRAAYIGDVSFADLPSLLAHERLRAQGYVVEEARYSATDLLIDAVARGTADIGNASVTAAWTAVARGARVKTLMEHAANPHRLVAVAGISTCADLDGRSLAVSEAGIATVLIRRFLADECPDAQPDISYIQESGNRVAALLAGGIDAAGIDLSQLHWLEEQAPSRFVVLGQFAERWPDVKTLGVHVNADFAAARRDLVVEYVRARVAANRDLLADLTLVVAQAERHLGPSPRWPGVAKAYLEARTWAADGGLSESDVTRTLAFFANEPLLQASADSVADLSFLREIRASATP